MLDHGVIALPAGPTVLRLLPPLVITEERDRHRRAGDRRSAIAQALKRLMDRAAAIELVRGLVAIPSLSRQEARGVRLARRADARAPATIAPSSTRPATPSASWATRRRAAHASSCSGTSTPSPATFRCASRPAPKATLLYGRGSVDAKGPLATFVAAAPRASDRRVGDASADLRMVVVGAVEEEAATSKGARFIAARFDGTQRADARRVHHRRAQSLASRHARLQGPAAARPHGRSADGAHRRSRRERRRGRRRSVELGRRRTPRASTTARTRSFDQLSPSLRRFITSTNDRDARHRGCADSPGACRSASTPMRWSPSCCTGQLHTSGPGPSWHGPRPGLTIAGTRTTLSFAFADTSSRGAAIATTRWCAASSPAIRAAGRVGAAGLRVEDRHQRHERRRARLAMSDRRLRSWRQRARSHAARASVARRIPGARSSVVERMIKNFAEQ